MITKDQWAAATPAAAFCAFGLAALLGVAWLIGVQHKDAMFDAGHSREAFAAVKRAAGPHMLVRKVEISPNGMTVLAFDPDMPPSRYVSSSGRGGPAGHWYNAANIYEQSWRVSYWTVFGHDWYRVSGPTPEGIGQQGEGAAFDLRPEEIFDLPELFGKVVPDTGLPNSSCRWTLIVATRWWTVCRDAQGDPVLVYLRSRDGTTPVQPRP
jgi:hypothetical protein